MPQLGQSIRILLLSWHFLTVVPMDIPVLPEVNIEHLLLIDVLEGLLLVFVVDEGFHLNDWSDIHEG